MQHRGMLHQFGLYTCIYMYIHVHVHKSIALPRESSFKFSLSLIQPSVMQREVCGVPDTGSELFVCTFPEGRLSVIVLYSNVATCVL